MAYSPTPAPVSPSPTPTRRRARKRSRWHSARTPARQEVDHAGEANARTGPTRPPRGQESHHAGRRVRARGDPPRARGQARRALGQAGHRHRPLQGAPGRRQAAAAEEGEHVGANAPQRHLGVPRRSARQAQDLRAPRAGHGARVEARAAARGLAHGALAPGQDERPARGLGKWGAPKWPPKPPAARRAPGEAVARLASPPDAGGAPAKLWRPSTLRPRPGLAAPTGPCYRSGVVRARAPTRAPGKAVRIRRDPVTVIGDETRESHWPRGREGAGSRTIREPGDLPARAPFDSVFAGGPGRGFGRG